MAAKRGRSYSWLSTFAGSQFRRYSAYIVAHPSSGTMRPALIVLNRFEATPTIHGRMPPPILDSTNISDPISDDDPNSRDIREIVMGYTQESPNPAAHALDATSANPRENTSPAIPPHAMSNPAWTRRISLEIGRAS